jgi:hypothetical protein
MEVPAVLYLFFFCFPISVCLWSVSMVAGGYVDSVPPMPWEFRLAVRVTGARRAEGFAPMAVPGPLLLLGFANLPLPFFLVGSYGLIGSISAAAYVMAQLLWLMRIRRANRRANRKQP